MPGASMADAGGIREGASAAHDGVRAVSTWAALAVVLVTASTVIWLIDRFWDLP